MKGVSQMNEHERIDYIKKETDATPIPESLEPEHIRERLSTGTSTTDTATLKTAGATASAADRKTSRPWYRNPWIYTAACLVLCFTGFLGHHYLTSSTTSSETAREESCNDLAADSNAESAPFDSAADASSAYTYRDLFELLKQNTRNYTLQSKYLNAVEDFDGASVTNDLSKGTYYETNHQVTDIAEADLVKTDGTYIYSCYAQDTEDSGDLNAVSITRTEQGDLSACSHISSDDIATALGTTRSFRIQELYLESSRLILLCTVDTDTDADAEPADSIICYRWNPHMNTYILTYDVSQPEQPVLLSTLMQEGNYTDSRLSDGCLYTFTQKWVTIPEDAPFSLDYFPQVNDSPIAIGDICLPTDTTGNCFQIITGMSLAQPDAFIASHAILSNNSTYYVSTDSIYFAQAVILSQADTTTQTELFRFHYADGQIEAEGQTTFPGTLLNQFAMDEYQGYLRVAATVTAIADDASEDSSSNSLYIINDNLEMVSSITDLAPDETIYSVRFMGDVGYFVTYRQTDPLFAVDLSDPLNPVITDTLKIPGFSNYLHAYSDHLLFGFGSEVDPDTGISQGLKLSMFDISDPYEIKEVNKTVLTDMFFSTAQYDHKSLMIDPEKNLIGFYAESYNPDIGDYNDYYIIYSYDPSAGFQEVFRCDILQDPDLSYGTGAYGKYTYTIRGLYIDNIFYLVNGNRICSYSMDTFRKLKGLVNSR